MKRRTRKNNSSNNDNNSLRRKQLELKKKENLFESDILTNKEKNWLKIDTTQVKCRFTRQYLTEENILKWKPIPKTSKKVLKKIISKLLLNSMPDDDDNEILKKFLVLENSIYEEIDNLYAPKEEIITEHLKRSNDELVKQIEQNLKEIQELEEQQK